MLEPLRSIIRPVLGVALLALLLQPTWAASVSEPGRSKVGLEESTEPVRIVPAPRPMAAASPFGRYEGMLSGLEVQLFADAVDGCWDDHCLLEAALIAGGATDGKSLAESTARFDRFVEQARQQVDGEAPADVLAEQLFAFMHKHVLTGGYELECTDLAGTLKDGRFNCVSSTVLFNCLATRFGLKPVAVELPGHAMSRLRVDGKKFDVETTCPSWFLLKDDPGRRAALVAKTIGAGRQATAQRPGREVSPVELVAMIFYNRGVDLLNAKRFAQAASANAKALRLDPSSCTARGNLLATLNNWAITVGAMQRFDDAIDLLEQGLSIDAKYATFTANYVHLHYQWSESLCSSEHFETALAMLTEADAEVIGADRLAQLRLDVYRRWAGRTFERGQSDKALSLLQTAEAQCRPAGALLQQVEAQTLADWAASLSRQNRRTEAVTLLDWGLSRHPDSQLLKGRRAALVPATAASAN